MKSDYLEVLKECIAECVEYHKDARDELVYQFGAGVDDSIVAWHDGCMSAFRAVLLMLDDERNFRPPA